MTLVPLSLIVLVAGLVWKSDNAVRIGHVERIANEGDAERLPQAFDENILLVGDAVAVGIAQDRYSIGVFNDRTRRRCTQVCTIARGFHDGAGSVADSETSTSPFGSTYIQRGCFRPRANALTVRPSAARGVDPSGQGSAVAHLIVGSQLCCGRAARAFLRKCCGALVGMSRARHGRASRPPTLAFRGTEEAERAFTWAVTRCIGKVLKNASPKAFVPGPRPEWGTEDQFARRRSHIDSRITFEPKRFGPKDWILNARIRS